MIAAEISGFALSVYILQIVLLPIQVVHYFFQSADIVRRRYLALSLSFLAFNTIWICPIDPSIKASLLVYVGILLTSVGYRYLAKEVNFSSGKLTPHLLLIILLMVQLFNELAMFNLSDSDHFFVQLSFTLIFTVVGSLFSVRAIVQLFNRESGTHHAMYTAGIASLILVSFIPLVTFITTGTAPEFFIINLIYAIISIAYLKHYFNEVKLNALFPKRRNDVNSLSIDERFIQLTDSIADLDLTSRQQEIASLLIQGKSYAEIADQLFLSQSTVRGHSATIFRKAGIYGTKKIESFRKKYGK